MPAANSEVVFRGGGWLYGSPLTHASSWPFARLTIREDSLDLAVWPWGGHLWPAGDIHSIEKVIWFPVLAWGIRITAASHTAHFWWWGHPGSILKAMRRVSFPVQRLES